MFDDKNKDEFDSVEDVADREKRLEKRKIYYQKNKQRIKEQNKKSRERHMDSYVEYNKRYAKENPDKGHARHKRWRDKNLESERERTKEWHKENKDYSPAWHRKERKVKAAKYILYSARARAKKEGIAFNLTPEDIFVPEYCPVLGIKLEVGSGQASGNSPSLDKIIPSLGYVKGNVMVISNRANSIKRDATLDEAEKIYLYIKRETDRILGK